MRWQTGRQTLLRTSQMSGRKFWADNVHDLTSIADFIRKPVLVDNMVADWWAKLAFKNLALVRKETLGR